MDESSEDPEPVSYFTDVVEEGNRFGILRGPHPLLLAIFGWI